MTPSSKVFWLTVLLLLCLFLAGCREETAAVPQATASTGSTSQLDVVQGGRLTALGTILPAQQLKLSFLVGGPVLVNHVQVGSEVKAGDLLAALDTTDLELAVQKAEETLAVSQARLRQAQAGPSEEAVAVAEAQARRAQAQVEQAQAAQERALTQTHPEQVAMAEADYQAALACYEQLKAGPDPEELAVAQAQVQKAELALQRAQAAYDRVVGQPEVGASPEAAALQEATVDYELAKAQVERLRRPPAPEELRESWAQVLRAEAQLRLAQVEPGEADLPTLAGDVAVAQAQLDLARTGPRSEDVAVAEVQVQQALTALEEARLAMTRAQLLAPFDGTVSAVYLYAGEWAAPGAPVVELLETSGWLVETRNIGELSIGRVARGQAATVRVMAFRGEELQGQVRLVSPIAVVQQGDTTYTVLIELAPTSLPLRPGMNAEVEIETE
jgi:HlyD family secretion protein